MHIYRASIVHFPSTTREPSKEHCYYEDGGLLVDGTKIVALDTYSTIKGSFPQAKVHDYRGKLIIPGLIDSHVHFPQTEMIASYGEQLMAWLENYTFPTEMKFADSAYCNQIADVFLNQLLKNGTTTALAYATVHAHSVDALFSAAQSKNMALITGKTCMDFAAECPENLRDTADLAVKESEILINRWHNNGRCKYAITPRFVPTSTGAQLGALGELASQYEDVFIQTHLSENKTEIEIVAARFPERASYLDVYDHYGLVRERAVFGHCIHLPESSWQTLSEKGASIAFCPSSNLFLGSGLFDLASANQYDIPTVLASDVGAGTSFNMLRTYGEAYKVCQLQQNPVDALSGLYMMTQGAAAAHGMEHEIGNLNPGTYADFVVLNPCYDELSALRNENAKQVSDVLFALSILGDDRAVEQTYVAGQEMLTPNT